VPPAAEATLNDLGPFLRDLCLDIDRCLQTLKLTVKKIVQERYDHIANAWKELLDIREAVHDLIKDEESNEGDSGTPRMASCL